MEQEKREVPSDAKIFRVLSDAAKEYEELLKISELVAETDLQTVQQGYYRDINHPLSIAIKG